MVSCHDVPWLVAHLLLHGSDEEGCAMARYDLGRSSCFFGFSHSSGRLVIDKAPHHMADNSSIRVVIVFRRGRKGLRANFGFL